MININIDPNNGNLLDLNNNQFIPVDQNRTIQLWIIDIEMQNNENEILNNPLAENQGNLKRQNPQDIQTKRPKIDNDPSTNIYPHLTPPSSPNRLGNQYISN